MLLAKMLERFCEFSPLTVMARMTLEFALSRQWVDDLFDRTAESQYTRELTMATMVDLMAPVVCGIHKSTRSSYLQSPGRSAPPSKRSTTSLRGSRQRFPRRWSANRQRDWPMPSTRWTAAASRSCLAIGSRFSTAIAWPPPSIASSSCARSPPVRCQANHWSFSIPSMLAIDIFACEDGHAQERSMLDRVLETIAGKDLWIADRNFCTAGFLRGIAERGGFFLIRYHRGLSYETCGEWKEVGHCETGYVMERTVKLIDDAGQWFMLRLVRVNLTEKTRDGDDELLLLTNLPRRGRRRHYRGQSVSRPLAAGNRILTSHRNVAL